jgi:hypothetical protein
MGRLESPDATACHACFACLSVRLPARLSGRQQQLFMPDLESSVGGGVFFLNDEESLSAMSVCFAVPRRRQRRRHIKILISNSACTLSEWAQTCGGSL